jgi:hypothetical protein
MKYLLLLFLSAVSTLSYANCPNHAYWCPGVNSPKPCNTYDATSLEGAFAMAEVPKDP